MLIFTNTSVFLVDEMFRVTKPGRLHSFHCMNLPSTITRDGAIGIIDFRGELIRLFVAAGWIFHSEVVIWKDPVTAMQRTKALGLMYKQLRKDSGTSCQGISDDPVTMREPELILSQSQRLTIVFPSISAKICIAGLDGH